MTRALALVAAALVLAGCGDDAPPSGEVVDSHHYEAWNQYIPGTPGHQSCTGTGTSRICTWYPGTPARWQYWPERFVLEIRSDDGRQQGERSASAFEFAVCPIGSHFPECTR